MSCCLYAKRFSNVCLKTRLIKTRRQRSSYASLNFGSFIFTYFHHRYGTIFGYGVTKYRNDLQS